MSTAVLCATQCQAQDVAQAAKQERARKEAQQKKSKHVYTEEDLKRAQILTSEDRARLEAKKSQPTPPAAEKSQDGVDAQSLPADAPLGDVARRLRRQKESQKLQRSAEFHLPLADAPVLASPKSPVQPLRPPILVPRPAPPRLAPYQPPMKRSPFERPRVFRADPPLLTPSHPPAVRVNPLPPATPAAPPVHVNPVQPAAPRTPRVGDTAKLDVVFVKRGDSLWKLARQNLGHGLRWHELLSVNPGISDPNRIVAGSQIYLPAAVSSSRATTKFTVQKGDTLSQIAQTRLGHASYAACIVHANPAIRDANLIYEGQVLFLPANCKVSPEP